MQENNKKIILAAVGCALQPFVLKTKPGVLANTRRGVLDSKQNL
jgi:hypothetical protein